MQGRLALIQTAAHGRCVTMRQLLFLAFLVPMLHAVDEPLTLSSADGREHTPLIVAEGKKASVLFFVSPYCPTANAFMPEISRICAEYAADFSCYLVHSDADVKQTDVLQHTE